MLRGGEEVPNRGLKDNVRQHCHLFALRRNESTGGEVGRQI
jgi:hypothetical protein